jgi:alpha-beta hydrolase superfamily lysophospholipase
MAVLTALLLVIGNPSVSWTPAPALARGMTDVHRISVDSSGMVQMKDVVAVLSRYLEASSGPVTAKRGARERVIGATGKHVIKRWNMTFRTCGVSFETTGPFLVVTVEADKPSRAKRYYRRMVSRLGEGAQASPRSQTRRTQQSSSAAPAKLGIARIPESRPAGPPVVLVHGMDSSPRAVAGASKELAQKGYDVYVFHYSSESRISDSGLFLGQELRDLHRTVKQKISLVTLSLGGVIALYAIERDPKFNGVVGRFIACAPPFKGAGLARFRPLSTLKNALTGLAAQGLGKVLVFQGLGDAAMDLEPGSRLLELLNKGRRRGRIKYSILAGNKPIIPAPVLFALSSAAQQMQQQGQNNELAGWLSGITHEATLVSQGKGDGVVLLSSTQLKGVRDREVLPINHMQFLAPPRRGGPIPGLSQVIKRLPRAR